MEKFDGRMPDESGNGRLPQYGKKGHKPRRGPISREKIDLDAIRTNDIKYWNQSAGYNNVTKFLWDLIVGYPRDITEAFATDYFVDNGIEVNTPTLNPTAVMAIDCAMGPGWAGSVNDGVNRGLAQIMSNIRASLSTSNIGFETADLGIYLSSTSSIAYTIGMAKRILESRRVWRDRNMVYPRALCKVMNVEWKDVSDNINVYAARLNNLIDRYNNMKIPDVAWCYDRQYAMMHNIFCDEPSDYGQLYVFRPLNYYVYSDTDHRAIANRFPWSDGDDIVEFSAILDIIDEMIEAWYSSSDLYQINGTLLRAFKDAPVQTMPDFDMDATVEPVQDRAHLMQIMNCTIVGNLDIDSLSIKQIASEPNFVIWNPASKKFSSLYNHKRKAHILRMFEDDISNDDNMEMTRLTTLYDSIHDPTDEDPFYYHAYVGCGSEIVVRIKVSSYNSVTDEITTWTLDSNEIIVNGDDPGQISLAMQKIAAISPFRYIPCFHLIYVVNNRATYYGIIGDLYNWKIYEYNDWRELQFNAYLSLWKPRI